MYAPEDTLLRFLSTLVNILSFLIRPIFWLLDQKRLKYIPPIDNRLLLISATKLAAEIRKGNIKSVDVVRAYIERIKAVNPIINAVVEDRFDAALREAQQVDDLISKNDKTEQELEEEFPLLGIPVTVKESVGVKGLSHSAMTLTPIGLNRKAYQDSEAIVLVRKAGAIILAVTNIPEFAIHLESSNKVIGRTLNPYNTNRTCGGSSGGEGALVGSGASLIGIGSDLGGSIRVPAAFNGIFGHKPTHAIVPTAGHFPIVNEENFQRWLVVGPITRYAEDLKLAMQVLSGSKAKLLRCNEKVDLNKFRVFVKNEVSTSMAYVQVDPEIADTLHRTVLHLSKKVAEVHMANEIDLQYGLEIFCSNLGKMEDLCTILLESENPKEVKNLYIEIGKALLGLSPYSIEGLFFLFLLKHNFFVSRSKTGYYKAKKLELLESFKKVLGPNGVLLLPTFPVPSFQHHQTLFQLSAVVYVKAFNILGLPSVSVPMGLNHKGLPIGIQIVSLPNQDRLCWAVAEELEKAFGGWIPPTGLRV